MKSLLEYILPTFRWTFFCLSFSTVFFQSLDAKENTKGNQEQTKLAMSDSMNLKKRLELADNIRNPSKSYLMVVEVETPDGSSLLEVYLKGKDKTLIVTKEPLRDKGRNMLMLDRDFIAYVPNLKRSQRLSLQQKLSGQVANGDIARTSWSGDYAVSSEKINSTNEKNMVTNPGEIQLLLKALKKNLTYAAIRLWLEEKTNRPLRAQYLSLNAKTILKTAYFEDYKIFEGQMRPGQIRIEDNTKAESFIRIKSMKTDKYEDAFFTEKNMETMR